MHALVEGRVQGVFYRAETQKKALQLGLTGWVRNLTDGRVEVFAAGTETALQSLLAWLQHGPARAEVKSVEFNYQAYQTFPDFSVRFD